jgi:hypothetical protein
MEAQNSCHPYFFVLILLIEIDIYFLLSVQTSYGVHIIFIDTGSSIML